MGILKQSVVHIQSPESYTSWDKVLMLVTVVIRRHDYQHDKNIQTGNRIKFL